MNSVFKKIMSLMTGASMLLSLTSVMAATDEYPCWLSLQIYEDKNYDNICNAPVTECAYVKITDYDIDNEGNYTHPVKESWCVLSLDDLVMLKEDIDRFLKAMDESHEM